MKYYEIHQGSKSLHFFLLEGIVQALPFSLTFDQLFVPQSNKFLDPVIQAQSIGLLALQLPLQIFRYLLELLGIGPVTD